MTMPVSCFQSNSYRKEGSTLIGITGTSLTNLTLSECRVNKTGIADVIVVVLLCSKCCVLVNCFLAYLEIDEMLFLFECLQSITIACLESIPITSISHRGFLKRTFRCVLYPNLFSTSTVKASKSLQVSAIDTLSMSHPSCNAIRAVFNLSGGRNVIIPLEIEPIPLRCK